MEFIGIMKFCKFILQYIINNKYLKINYLLNYIVYSLKKYYVKDPVDPVLFYYEFGYLINYLINTLIYEHKYKY